MPNSRDLFAATLAIVLTMAGVAGSAALLERAVRGRQFPADHGVAVDAPMWVHCAAETIERHPIPFTVGGFAITRTGVQSARVDGTHSTFNVAVVEGYVVYWFGRGNHLLPLDCPSAVGRAG